MTGYRSYTSASSVLAEGPPRGRETGQAITMSLARFSVSGLTCAAEAVRLERRLTRVSGVLEVAVNPINEIAYIGFDPSLTSPDRIGDTIEGAGFGARALTGQ
jgi:P-type Cu+ transporter